MSVKSIVAVPGTRVNPVVVAAFHMVPVESTVHVPEPMLTVRVVEPAISKPWAAILNPFALNVPASTHSLLVDERVSPS